MMTNLVIVVPCYNEEPVLRETTARLLDVAQQMETMAVKTRLLFVDDGSGDKTWEIIQALAAEHAEVCGLKLAHNAGHQRALWAGLEQAARMGDAIVSIDADLQDDVEAIPKMVAHFKDGCEVVFGVRSNRNSDTFFKRTSAQMFYKMMTALGGDVVYNHADFRLMSRRAVAALMAFPERNLFPDFVTQKTCIL